jgi:hypothetical protein
MGERDVCTDEHFCAIGKVADAWATLELYINRAIWELMDVEQAIGACTTANVSSFNLKNEYFGCAFSIQRSARGEH